MSEKELDSCVSETDLFMLMRNEDVVEMGKEYPIDKYILRLVYRVDNVTPTHFIITKRVEK